jgi:catalase
MSKPERLTNATWSPVPDNTNILTAGRRGPARAINGASQEVLDRHVANCRTADPAYGDGVARALQLHVFQAG